MSSLIGTLVISFEPPTSTDPYVQCKDTFKQHGKVKMTNVHALCCSNILSSQVREAHKT